MAAKVWATQQKAVDEIFFRNEAVSLCLLINRRAGTMRVIDFRAGPTSAKRLFVLSLAQREGVSKVYTLVERDEVQTWLKLGFAKEGTIPGFYKRSDAFLLGCSARAPLAIARRSDVDDDDDPPQQSEMRIALAGVAGAAAPVSAAHDRMERTVAAAKRGVKDGAEGALPAVKIAAIEPTDSRKAVAAALRSGRALTAYEAFGRDIERRFFVATARGGFELHASIELQSCFGNAFLEILQSPRTPAEKAATTAVLGALCDKLVSEEVVTCFSLAPSDDLALATAYVQNGFRRTGLLLDHLVARGERKDAIVWSRKLANPTDD
ncbi:MAG TPA: hypothetical protein VH044_00605 [Polyangiaceae bacterium]|jgi:hypothetical protein|nr:hypothetical protein [Polyangiaceae bacterium]